MESNQKETTNSKSKFTKICKYAMLGFAITGIVSTMIPQVRKSISAMVHGEERKVLSTVSGDVTGEGEIAKVVKVKTTEGIFIEIYSKEDNELVMIDQIELKNSKDGYFMFNGEASNLILEDVDGDSVVEILAPSYDENLMAHLNIFSFNKTRNKFIKLN